MTKHKNNSNKEPSEQISEHHQQQQKQKTPESKQEVENPFGVLPKMREKPKL